MSEVGRLLQKHPQAKATWAIAEVLQQAGHRVLFAGGCVRDALLGVTASDLDLATSASPEQIAGLFPRTVDVGRNFGVMRVILDGADIEVATFRKDQGIGDGRHPVQVIFTDEKEDALRRDFTVNAMFYDPFSDQVIDYVDGQRDLQTGVLRTVGEPALRFQEDHLRLLRAVRFAVQLKFQIDPGTWVEVQRLSPTVSSVSRERIREELFKLLKQGPGKPGIELLQQSGILKSALPTLDDTYDVMGVGADIFLQERFDSVDEVFLRWVAILLIQTKSHWRNVSAALESLRFSKAQLSFLKRAGENLLMGEAFWGQTSGAQLIQVAEPAVSLALRLKSCHQWDPRVAKLLEAFDRVAVNGELPKRWIVGGDLLPFVKGAELGRWLDRIFEGQLEGRFQSREAALQWFQQQLGKSPQ